MLAKHVLYQLSYTPFCGSFYQSLRQVPSAVLTAARLLRSSTFTFLDLGKNNSQINGRNQIKAALVGGSFSRPWQS